MVRSISSTIFKAERLNIDLSVNLVNGDKDLDYVRMTKNQRGEYINITPNASLKFRRIRDKNEPYLFKDADTWNPKENLFIIPSDFYTLKSDLDEFYQKFQDPNIFRYDQNGYPVSIRTPIQIVSSFRFDQFVKWEPTLLIDPRRPNVYYPGVNCCINYASQESPLAINEFEMLHGLIMNFDFYREGMQLLTNFLLIQNNMKYYRELTEENKPVVKTKIGNMGIFEQAERRRQQEEDEATSKMPIIKQPDTLDDL